MLLWYQRDTKVGVRHTVQMENLQMRFWGTCSMSFGSLNQIQDIKVGQGGKKKGFGKLFLCIVSALMRRPTLQSREGVPVGPLCSLWFGDLQGWAVTSMPAGKRWLLWVPLLSWCLSRQKSEEMFFTDQM